MKADPADYNWKFWMDSKGRIQLSHEFCPDKDEQMDNQRVPKRSKKANQILKYFKCIIGSKSSRVLELSACWMYSKGKQRLCNILS